MTQYFYSHLISFDSLEEELDTLKLTKQEKQDLLDIANTHTHQQIIESILSQLSEEDKKKFLELLAYGEDEKIWKHLNEKVDKIEDKIKDASNSIKKELREDIKRIKSK
jgi:hypothetical protein